MEAKQIKLMNGQAVSLRAGIHNHIKKTYGSFDLGIKVPSSLMRSLMLNLLLRSTKIYHIEHYPAITQQSDKVIILMPIKKMLQINHNTEVFTAIPSEFFQIKKVYSQFLFPNFVDSFLFF